MINVPGVLGALAVAIAAHSALAAPGGTLDRTPITYEVSPRLSGQDLAGLEIAVTFEADADGETRLILPDASMGRSGLWRNVTNLTIEGADSVAEDGPAIRVVRSRPGRQLVLRYALGGTLDRDPRQSDGYPPNPGSAPPGSMSTAPAPWP